MKLCVMFGAGWHNSGVLLGSPVAHLVRNSLTERVAAVDGVQRHGRRFVLLAGGGVVVGVVEAVLVLARRTPGVALPLVVLVLVAGVVEGAAELEAGLVLGGQGTEVPQETWAT